MKYRHALPPTIFLALFLLLAVTYRLAAAAQTIRVPEDAASIQDAIDLAQDGDTILVAPGVYPENLVLAGKSVTLASYFHTTGDEGYIDTTIIDGGDSDDAVIFVDASVGPETTIVGFTIQNAKDGIDTEGVLNIVHNRITATSDGIDYNDGGGGLCRYNVFEENRDDAIDLDEDAAVIIEENVIRNNADDGIEIRLHKYTGDPIEVHIRNNLITGSGEDGIQFIDYDTNTPRVFFIENNLIADSQDVGVGMMGDANTEENYEAASIPERIYLFNNTFVGNHYGLTGGDNVVAVNNIFAVTEMLAVKHTDGNSILAYNLFWNNGTDFEGANVDSETTLSADPLLDDTYHLEAESPAIDAGTAVFTWEGSEVLALSPEEYSGGAPDLGAYETLSPSDPTPTPEPALTPTPTPTPEPTATPAPPDIYLPFVSRSS